MCSTHFKKIGVNFFLKIHYFFEKSNMADKMTDML